MPHYKNTFNFNMFRKLILPLLQMLKFLVPTFCLVSLTSAALTLDAAAIAAFVDGHNQLRANTGAGLNNLRWSSTLADYAASRTDKCVLAHDSTRAYGENLYWHSWSLDAKTAATKAVESWGSEIANVDPAWNCAITGGSKTCGHYSQQVWRTTTQVGCAITQCAGAGTYVFCEYNPPGNMMKWDWHTMSAVAQPPY